MTGDGKTARADGFAASIVAGIPIPPMALLRQSFPRKEAGDVQSALRAGLRSSGVLDGGMDPHIVGRFVTPAMSGGISSRRLVVLDITGESEGSGIGLGRADLSTRRAFEKFDFEKTYTNALTSNVLEPSRIPVIMANDRLAIAAAIKTCTGADKADIRVVRIKNSLEIDRLYVTENLMREAGLSGRVETLAPPAPLIFDDRGVLAPFP